MSFELRAGTEIENHDFVEDGDNFGASIYERLIYLVVKNITTTEKVVITDLKISKTYIDKISQFDIRPPELRQLIDSIGEYYR